MAMFIAAAAAVGTIGWSGEVLLLPVACLFPALWAFSPSRLVAGLVSMAYFMAASRGLPVGVSIFYATDMWLGLVLWVAASLSFVLVHTVLWSPRSGWPKAVRYAVAAIMMSVPPFGIVGWASPITAAGVLFPGWGWVGLIAVLICLLAMTTQAWTVTTIVLAGSWALSVMNWALVSVPGGWIGINTDFEYAAGEFADYNQHVATIALVRRAAEAGATHIILPESALGIWTASAERLWMRGLNELDVAVLGGAIVVGDDGYDNVMVTLTSRGSEIVYRERMPVPISMWRPWTSGGAVAHFFDNPTGSFSGKSIAPLICYEQLIMWPVLQSMLISPDLIVATGNGWWTGDTNIVSIQHAAVVAWARLFGLPVVSAFNG
ncbi:MAG: conjugal transfer protein TraB [Thermomicrobiales bacterium]